MSLVEWELSLMDGLEDVAKRPRYRTLPSCCSDAPDRSSSLEIPGHRIRRTEPGRRCTAPLADMSSSLHTLPRRDSSSAQDNRSWCYRGFPALAAVLDLGLAQASSSFDQTRIPASMSNSLPADLAVERSWPSHDAVGGEAVARYQGRS